MTTRSPTDVVNTASPSPVSQALIVNASPGITGDAKRASMWWKRAGSEPHRQHGYVNPPIYRGSTVLYEGVEAMDMSQADPLKRSTPAYGRFGTPTAYGLALLCVGGCTFVALANVSPSPH